MLNQKLPSMELKTSSISFSFIRDIILSAIEYENRNPRIKTTRYKIKGRDVPLLFSFKWFIIFVKSSENIFILCLLTILYFSIIEIEASKSIQTT